MTAEHDGAEPRRVSYFNGQFLQEQDFQAEQDYHIAQRRRLTRLTRGAGIVSGLEVEITGANDGQLSVAAGLAVDGDGNLLVLPERRPVTVEYQGVATGFLLIEYGDQGDRLVDVGGGRPTRQVERPVIRFAPADEAPPAGKGVRLARLKLDGKKISAPEGSRDALDLSVRREAGLDLGGDLAVRGAATVGDPGRPRPLAVHGPTIAAGGLTVERGQAQLKDGLSVSGGATIAAGGLTVEQGQAQLKDGLSVSGGPAVLNSQMLRIKGGDDANHGIVFNSTIDGPEFRAHQGFLWKNGAAGATERMRLGSNGNLAIGTVDTSLARLFVQTSGEARSLWCEHTGSNFIVRPYASGSSHAVIENTAGALYLNPDTSGSINIVKGPLNFGSTTRQMLNLWGTAHSIGVQNGTTYFRSSNHFGWYKGGEHSDTSLAAGSGGTALMTLNGEGTLSVAGQIKATKLSVGSLSTNTTEQYTSIQSLDAKPLLLNPDGQNVAVGPGIARPLSALDVGGTITSRSSASIAVAAEILRRVDAGYVIGGPEGNRFWLFWKSGDSYYHCRLQGSGGLGG